MSDQIAKAERFRALHDGPEPLLMPNPWDAGSAKIFESLGFEALATTSSGFAATLARLDGGVTRDQAIAHAAAVAAATTVPVSADLENGFVDDPADVAETVRMAIDAGLAGCSIEDHTRNDDDPIYDAAFAAERIEAAAKAAHSGPVPFVLTARTEIYLHGRKDLDEAIARLQAFSAAGADVLFAPGITDLDEIRALCAAVDKPVNVLVMPGIAPVADLAAAGVRRISVGGAFAYAAYGAAIDAATMFREQGAYGYWANAGLGAKTIHRVFS